MSDPDLSTNGQPPEEDPILAPLIQRLSALRKEEDHMRSRVDVLTAERKRLERGLSYLTGEAPGTGNKRGPYKKTPVRGTPSGVSDERIDQIRRGILKLSETQETFRQVDLRSSGLMPNMSSGQTAISFKKLRDENFIRLVSQDGNNKWYRVTREAAKASES